IHKAAYKGDIPLLVSLIATCENIDVLNYYGCSPLHLAIRGHQAEGVRLLLEAGADPDVEDIVESTGQTVLHGASCLGNAEMIRYFVERGANVRTARLNGDTALHNAARIASAEIFSYLIEQGADVHAVNSDGETVLHVA
ncbi:ankyrin, partial [Pyrenochaeta sp. DS3sAY3a]